VIPSMGEGTRVEVQRLLYERDRASA